MPGFGEGEDVRAVVATDMQHDRGVGAFRLPIPVLRIDQPAVGGGARHGDDGGAAVQVVLGALEPGPQRRPFGELEDFGAGIQQHHALEIDVGALGDAAHLRHVIGVERLDDRQIGVRQFGHAGATETELFDLPGIMREPEMHPRFRRLAELAAAFPRRPGDLDQRECLGHAGLLLHCADAR